MKKSAQIILSRTIFNSSVKRPRLGCSIDYFSPRGPISRCIVVHQSPVVRCPIIVNDAQRRRTRFYNCDRCTINFTRRILRYAANQLKGLNISLYDLDRYMKMSTHFLYIFHVSTVNFLHFIDLRDFPTISSKNGSMITKSFLLPFHSKKYNSYKLSRSI